MPFRLITGSSLSSHPIIRAEKAIKNSGEDVYLITGFIVKTSLSVLSLIGLSVKVCAQLVTTGQTFASIRVVCNFIRLLSDYCVTNGMTLDINETNYLHIRHRLVMYMEYNSIANRKMFC